MRFQMRSIKTARTGNKARRTEIRFKGISYDEEGASYLFNRTIFA